MSDDGTSIVGQIVEATAPGSFVTKYALITEVIDTDGKKDVWVHVGDDVERWDCYGLLTEALEQLKADHLVSRMDEDL